MSGALQRGVALAAALVLLAALGWTILRPAGQYRVTAFFTETVGLYPGSDVRVLGIPIGTITDVVAAGRQGPRRDEHRRRLRRPGRRRRRSSWRRRWSPTGTCSSRRSTTAGPTHGGRRRGAAGAHRHPGGARRGLRRPRRAVGGARPQRRQRERRAVGPGRRRRGQPRGQRRGAEPDAHRLLPGRGDPGGEPRRPVRLAGQPADVHHRAGHDRRAGRSVQRQHGRRQRAARRRARGPAGRGRAAAATPWATWRASSGTTRRC